MRQKLKLVLPLVLAILVIATESQAYTINADTKVESWYLRNATNWNGANWHDTVGDLSVYKIFGANLSGNTLTISTNWPGKGYKDFGVVPAGDLFLDLNLDGKWDFAIRLREEGLGKVFKSSANSWYRTSEDIFKNNGNYIYGGRYDKDAPKAIPVNAILDTTHRAEAYRAAVIWEQLSGGNPNSEVSIDLSALPGFDWHHFAFLYSTGICGNSVMYGEINLAPLPPSLLLLGSGLLGLGLLGFRRRRRKS